MANKKWTVLFLVLVLGLVFRSFYWGRHSFLFGSDPYYHYSVLNLMMKSGGVPEKYALTYFPYGIVITHPPGFYFVSFVPNVVLSGLGFDAIWSMRASQVAAGLFHILFLYLITRKVSKPGVALFSALFLATNLAHIYRTSNHYRGDPFALSSFFLGFYFLLLAFEKRQCYLSILAGLFIGSAQLFWRGYPVFFMIVFACFIFYIFYLQIKKRLEWGGLVLSLVLLLSASFSLFVFTERWGVNDFQLVFHVKTLLISGFSLSFRHLSLILAGVILLSGLILLKLQKTKSISMRITVPIVILSLILLTVGLIFPEFVESLVSGGGLLIPTSSAPRSVSGEFYRTISELQPPSLDYLWTQFNIVLFLAPIGLVLFLFKFNEKKALILPWILVSAFLIFTSRRYSFLASPMLCFLAGIAIGRFWKDSKNHFIKMAVVGVFLIVGAGTYHFMFSDFSPLIETGLQDAILWIKNNTAQNATVFAFWDRSAFIEALAERATFINSVYQLPKRVNSINAFFLTNSALPVPRANYVLVDEKLVLNLAAMYGTVGHVETVISSFYLVERPGPSQAVFRSHSSNVFVNIVNDDGLFAFFENGTDRILSGCLILRTPDGVLKTAPRSADGFRFFSSGCVYADVEDDVAVWASDAALESNLFKLLFLDGFNTTTPMRLRYSNGFAKVYEVL